MTTVRIHGKKGLIYLSGSELTEASVCTISHTTDSEEGPVFGDTYPQRAVGLQHWSGSISAWAAADQKLLQASAQVGFAVALLAYIDRADQTDYYSGNVVVSFEHSIDVGSLQAITSPFDGAGSLTLTGFAA